MKQPRIFHSRAGYAWYYKKLTLGCDYMVRCSCGRWMVCRFIKVTRKGFNLLHLSTSKCIMRRHLYAAKWSGKDIPGDVREFTVHIPEWLQTGDQVSKEEAG